MSVYNGALYVKEAVVSILKQTYRDWELIIINDASTDKTLEILNDLATTDDRIKIITNAENIGLTKSLNRGLLECSGEFVARMDADDVASSDRLEKQYDFMQTHLDVAVCGSQGIYIDHNGNKIGDKDLKLSSDDIKKKLLFNNQCIHSSLFFRKSIVDELGGYNEQFKTSQDYELIVRIAKKYQVVNLKDRLIHWRVHPGSVSWASKKQEWDAIRVRWWAITKYDYSKLKGLPNIFLRLGWLVFPQTLKRKRYIN